MNIFFIFLFQDNDVNVFNPASLSNWSRCFPSQAGFGLIVEVQENQIGFMMKLRTLTM